jgi:hypothetical protein
MAAKYMIADPIIGVPVPVSQTYTFNSVTSLGAIVGPPFPFGLVAKAVDNQSGSTNLGAGQFIFAAGYSTASAVSSAGQWVQLRGNTAWLALHAQSASKFPMGVAAGPLSNTNVCGWVQIQGIADYVRGNSANAGAGAPLYLIAATAGVLQSVASAGAMVLGAVYPVTADATLSNGAWTAQLNYPQMVGLTASV